MNIFTHMIDNTLEIKYFFNDETSKTDLQIKDSPFDFIVQERTSDNVVCTKLPILDIERYIESVNFLVFVFHSKIKNEEEIEEYLTKSYTVQDLSYKELKLRYRNLEYLPIPIQNKDLRTRIYKILSYNPLINTKTVDDSLFIKKSDTNTYIFTLMKVMMNTIDACKMVERHLNSPVSFAGNKDKKAVTYQEVSIKCNFINLIDFAYEYTNCSKEDYQNIKIFKFLEDIEISDEEGQVISEGLEDTKRIKKEIYKSVKYKDDREDDREEDKEEDKEDKEEDKEDKEEDKEDKEEDKEDDREEDKEDKEDKEDVYTSSYYDSSIGIYNIRKGHSKRLGDLKGNKFIIKIKNQADLNYKNMEKGFINYYGTQRFGKAKNNHLVGEKILNKEYTEALNLIIKNSKGYDLFIKGDLSECLRKCDNTERYIFKNKGVISDKKIVFGMRREIRMIYLHSYQSYLFNKEVNKFIENQNEKNLGYSLESSLDLKKMNDKMLKGGTRKIFERCYNVEGWKDKEDFVVSFELNSSCYATMALREL